MAIWDSTANFPKSNYQVNTAQTLHLMESVHPLGIHKQSQMVAAVLNNQNTPKMSVIIDRPLFTFYPKTD